MKGNLKPLSTVTGWDAIKEAHKLCYESERIENYYDTWSSYYNRDVFEEEYSAPRFIADYLVNLVKNHLGIDPKNQDLEILDAGCGTGLVGMALDLQGFQNIDGFDLSHQMAKEAKKTKVYRSLQGGCDMTSRIEAFPDNRYQATVCCGVFTTGHVPPTALEELIRITKTGGLLVLSTRKSYYDNSEFKLATNRLQKEGKFQTIDFVMDGSYIAEEGAHYWAFEIS